MSLHLYLSQLYGRRVSKHNFARKLRSGKFHGTKATYFNWLINKMKKGEHATLTSD